MNSPATQTPASLPSAPISHTGTAGRGAIQPAATSGTSDRPLVPAAPFAALDGTEAEALALLLDAFAQSSWRCNGREHPMTVELWGLADEIRGIQPAQAEDPAPDGQTFGDVAAAVVQCLFAAAVALAVAGGIFTWLGTSWPVRLLAVYAAFAAAAAPLADDVVAGLTRFGDWLDVILRRFTGCEH